MLQLIQEQKKGNILVSELPAPQCLKGGILVRTHYSLISAGTEKTSVSKAKSSLISRAKKQPEDVKMVLDFLKRDGILATYKRVKSKLDSYKELGYSASGVVIESNTADFSVGDRVAVAGAGYANHSEIITVPKNLATKIPQNVDFESAAYTTVASIAMQGIRQSDVRIGETVAVIGLGLIGQITVQLLKASGARVIAMDINDLLFEKAKEFGADLCLKSSFSSKKDILAFTRGIACDSVIITAGTSSNEPIELALEICRKKGKIVIVGAVGMDIPRAPFYLKEIDLRISCSYGPGRYDTLYEEKGIDYPYAYVRWTENRNMIAILDLLSENKINFNKLTSHQYKIEEANFAYDLIMGKINEPYLGILLKYDIEKNIDIKKVNISNYQKNDKLAIGFVGLGAFARNYLIPPILKYSASLVGVASQNPVNARSVAENLNFSFFSTNGDEIINDDRINLVFIATRHDSHSKYVINALKSGKPVFVEKPLAINQVELDEIREVLNRTNGRLMVGFNRRFSKSFQEIKKFFANRTDPLFINYRINAGFIPKSHWVQHTEQGGRIIGEVCHFIDTMVYLCSAVPISVFAQSISSSNIEITPSDCVSIIMKFSDGSVGNINYIASGASQLPKEYCEVHSQNKSAIMNNFETLDFYDSSNQKSIKLDGKKGIDNEVKHFLDAVKNAEKMPIDFEEIYKVTKTTFGAIESLESGKIIEI